jgi:cell division septation protein DedD
MKTVKIVLLLAIIAFVSAIMINPIHASGTATIGIDSATQHFSSAQVGNTIQINITVSNVQDLWGWDISDISFNPAMLSLTQVTEGPFLQAAGQTMFLWTSTSTVAISQGDIPDIQEALLSTNSAAGSGVIATLAFNVLSLGTSQITFNQSTLYDNNPVVGSSPPQIGNPISSNAINGDITVGSSSSTPSPSPSSAPTSTPTSPSGTSTSDPSSTSPSSATPTSSPNTLSAPEFPIAIILIPLFAAATLSILFIAKKAKLSKK